MARRRLRHFGLLGQNAGYTPRDLDEAVMQSRHWCDAGDASSVYLAARVGVTRVDADENAVRGDLCETSRTLNPRTHSVMDRIDNCGWRKAGTAAGNSRKAARRESSDGISHSNRRVLDADGNPRAASVRTAVRGGARSQSYEYARMANWIALPEQRPSRSEALGNWRR